MGIYRAKNESNVIKLFESKNDPKILRHYPKSSIIHYNPESTTFEPLEL